MPAFQPRVGEPVLCSGRRCHIREILSLTRCILQPDEPDARPLAANISDLRPVPEAVPASNTPEGQDYSNTPDKYLEIAARRLEIIRPMLSGRLSHKEVKELAKANGVAVSTLYRWVAKHRRTELTISLSPMYGLRGAPLVPRLPEEQENILTEEIEKIYLTPLRPPVTEVYKEVVLRCRKLKVKPPSLSTVHNRIRALDQRVTTRARHGRDAAKRHEPSRGTLPGANDPWDIIHIDHTQMGIIIVDKVYRKHIGRAHITVAEDAATRVVVGFYVSLEPPSQFSTGLCLVHAMLPKEQWMAQRNIPGSWPVWGQPKVFHTDNGDGFRGKTLRRACKELGIRQEFRRVGHPEDGGRMERLIGTLERELHKLPGSTFSNPQKRGAYKSEDHAVFTLDELETLIGNFIVNIYHQRPHRGLGGKPPIKAYEDGLLGTRNLPGLGLPRRENDPDKLRLSFLPGEECTVQKHGLTLDHVVYFHDSLKRWVGVKQPDNPNRSLRFWVQRDPRDISRVWFEDPELQQRIEVPYRDMTRPVISLWELEAITEHLKKEGCTEINEELIFTAHEHQKQLVAESTAKTKTARRQQERERRRKAGGTQYSAPIAPPPFAAADAPRDVQRQRVRAKPYEDVEN